jgi:acyl-[acyl-carrier-protein]-phospholipid O-acyltransferase/long-chain-fatty-acid--[acyl-carrier-protein] ligase
MPSHSSNRLELIGDEHIPAAGGMLIIPNRLLFEDLLLLERRFGGRKVIYLIERGLGYDPLLQAHLEKDDVEAIEFCCEETMPEAFKRQIHHSIEDGAVLMFIPGDTLVRPGQNQTTPARILNFLIHTGAPVLPLHVERPIETGLSIEPIRDLDRIVHSFGRLLEREAVTLANYQERMLLAGEEAFSRRPILKTHLAWALLRGLKKHGSTDKIIDGNDESELRFDKLLAAALVLAGQIRRETNQPRVGIILPPGKGGMLANLAVIFAGKVPVNLNFTAGEKAVASCIAQAGLDKFITADPFVRKMSRFPWPPNKQLIFIERLLPKLKTGIALWYVLSKILPAGLLAAIHKIPKRGDHEEAVLLFTSGSSGDPKGVTLSHRNLLANVNQFGTRIDLKSDDKVLGCLPLFHSFGCTVTLWYPIIEGVTLVTYPSPLEAGRLAELIEKYRISLVLATPTFLRGYLKKARAEQFASVKLFITGAEKLPTKVAEAFRERFDKPVLEGYGLTETSPVSNVNMPNPEPAGPDDRRPVIENLRAGSVGHPIPGVAVRITDPNTDEPLSLHHSGMIWLRGPNIFEGYLGQPEKTAEVIRHGWFRTGDIGRMDDDGFLYIEGRLSRFSKIGGEMVPHETVEAAINEALGFDTESERKIAIVGVPDEQKGEALILLSAAAGLEVTDLRYRLLDRGLPSLWIPRSIVEVPEIPLLASGKLDIKGCEMAVRGE